MRERESTLRGVPGQGRETRAGQGMKRCLDAMQAPVRKPLPPQPGQHQLGTEQQRVVPRGTVGWRAKPARPPPERCICRGQWEPVWVLASWDSRGIQVQTSAVARAWRTMRRMSRRTTVPQPRRRTLQTRPRTPELSDMK